MTIIFKMDFRQTSFYLSKGNVYVVNGDGDLPIGSASWKSLRHALETFGYNVMTFSGPETFLSEIKVSPAVCLFDIQENDWGGVALLAQLNEHRRRESVVFLGSDSNSREIVKTLKSGAVDFLIKPFTLSELCAVIEAAMALEVENSARDLSEGAIRILLKTLTTRELEICFLMVRGYGNIEIAEMNGSAPGTVKIHRNRVLSKMGVDNLAGLIKLLCINEHQHWQTLNS